MREYLIFCQDCNEYSLLGQFLEKKGAFEGEFSFLHNARMETDELLCRFLIEHERHSLRLIGDRTDNYRAIIGTATRYMEKGIDRFVEQALEQKQLGNDKLSTERALGQLQLTILKQMFEEEVKEVAETKSVNAAESQFLLGKEAAYKKGLEILHDLIKKAESVK
ncbi:hypothetical protein J2S74_005234 [Evansella vedderi]|uniref:Uncharacterized protein n=1 Tax=Evansella vedderi TaxID=38282 RepID=A0ABU0A436_9BACI|nr:hypothetical protein [Evansella vedderi]MDQ0257772.1 hypothetical protein [Evansella vedderi]